ncbi:helix-turn-helix domain-containing protein [Rhodanobacter sp. L36]|uniref:helix-turn-helix domain-containing protein n=1 Tax=Rhodanobacter sp. L36 TaxID=1747221 RepID=UPI00131EC23D|nr:helix-turn-helix domain-containing protein [Rhodanobacter sp. L36]
MSFQILNAAWKVPLTPAAKLVYVALADMANDGGECFPSNSMLAERTGLSGRAVQKHIALLESAGYLQRDFRGGRSTVYTVTPAHGAPLPRTTCTPPPHEVHPAHGAPSPPHHVHPTPAQGAGAPAPRSPITTTQPPSNRQLNHQQVRSKPIDIPEWLPIDAWQDWCQYRQTGKGRFTDKAKALSLRTLTKFHDEGHDAKALIELAIEHGWQGIYPPRTAPSSSRGKPPIAQQFGSKTYTGTTDDELPDFLRTAGA